MGQDQKAKTEHYEEIEDYDYNNPNDTSNFCPGLEVREEELSPVPDGGRSLPWFPLPLLGADSCRSPQSNGSFLGAQSVSV